MVRLRAWGKSILTAHVAAFQFLMVRLRVLAATTTLRCPPLFQFLMVRLKGSNGHHHAPVRLISIPYGSIRGGRDMRPGRVRIQFQFLMVRLEVICLLPIVSRLIYFNSLWFD